jgi:hypothetical protein
VGISAVRVGASTDRSEQVSYELSDPITAAQPSGCVRSADVTTPVRHAVAMTDIDEGPGRADGLSLWGINRVPPLDGHQGGELTSR